MGNTDTAPISRDEADELGDFGGVHSYIMPISEDLGR